MRILVYPHDLKMGGSQMNAIEIAAAVQGQGHDVVVFGQPGPLVEYIGDLGLEFVESPPVKRRPSLTAVNKLRHLVESRSVQVLHGYEWPPSLECHLAARHKKGPVVVSTVMSMAVAPFIPASLPLTVGTHQIAAVEHASGRPAVTVLEPPVDVARNRPGLRLDQDGFRIRWGIRPGAHVVVMVSRLAYQLKLEGIFSAIEVVSGLARAHDTQLLIVGDGPARAEVMARAEQINSIHDRKVVLLTGEMDDPRAAYDVADVCLGMGGSALRGMAFAKPLVVQGELGFWELLTPVSVDQFLWQGWYGMGQDKGQGKAQLGRILSKLLPNPALRSELGEYGLSLIRERFSLERAADTQIGIYSQALRDRATLAAAPNADWRAAARFANYEGRRLLTRWTGREASDDFNSRPIAARANLVARNEQ
jgi:glycosyltransferase involved in cell wall biosynthesis